MPSILVEILGSTKQFKAELAGAEAATARASGGFSKLGAVAGTAGLAIGAGLAYGAVKSVEAATKFQSSMELIQTQAGGSAKEVKNMSSALLDMAAKVGSTPEELSKGLYHVESAGFRGAKALSVLRLAAEGAAVGHSDLESTTTALVAAQRSGIKGLGDMSHAMGSLNAIVGAGNMRMDDLTSALGTGVLPVAKAFGASITDVGAALATMTSNGIPAVNAASGLKMMLASMAAPTSKARDALKSIGIHASDLADTIRSKGLFAALTELKAHITTAGLTATQAAALLADAFGKKSSTGLLTLIGNLGAMKKAQDQVSSGASSFGANWEETQKSAEFATNRFHAAISALEIRIGAALLPTVTRFTNWLTAELPVAIAAAQGAIAFLSPYFTQLKVVIEAAGQKLGEFGGYIGQAVDAFMAMQGHSDAIKAALAVVGVAVAALTIQVIALNLVMLANPFVLLVVALAALAAGLVLAYENSVTFRNIVNETFAAVKTAASAALGWITNTGLPDFMRAWRVVEPVVVGAVNGIIGAVQAIVNGIRENWGTITSIIVPPIETAWNQVKLTFNNAKTIIINIVDGFKNLLEGHWGAAWGNLKTVVSAVISQITGTISNGLQLIAETAGRLAENVGQQIIQGILNGLSGLKDALQNKIQSTLGSVLSSINIPGFSPPDHAAAQAIGMPLAQGTIDGWLTGSAALPAAMTKSLQAAITAGRAVIQAAQASFQTAWSQLASGADAAFGGIIGGKKTPAEAQLSSEQAGRDAAARQAALISASDELTTAAVGGDPAAIAAAEQKLSDAQLAIHIAGLEKQAAEERIQLDARNAYQQTKFDEALTNLQTHLAKGHTSYAKAHEAIIKLFKTFGVDYKAAGAELGTAFITGLKELIQDAAKGSGSLSGKLENVAAGIHIPHAATGGFVSQTGLAVIHAGETITPAGGGGNVYLTVNGWVGDEQALLEKIRNGLIRTGRTTTGGAFGKFA